MIALAIEKLIKSLLSNAVHYSDSLKHTTGHGIGISSLIKPKAHRCLEFVTIIKGNAALQLDSTIINIQPNDVWAILPQTFHCEGSVEKKSYVLLWAVVVSRGLNFFLSEYNSSTQNRVSTNRLFVEFADAQDLWEISRNTMLSKDLLLQAKFISLLLMGCVHGLIDIHNTDNKSSAWAASHQKLIQQIKDYIAQHCRENLSIAELSAFAGYTPNHLCILFKKYTKQSIHKYLMQVRLQLAKETLESGQHQIKKVAFLSGFNDQLYFSRIFKKTFGRSPSEYLDFIKASQSKTFDSGISK